VAANCGTIVASAAAAALPNPAQIKYEHTAQRRRAVDFAPLSLL